MVDTRSLPKMLRTPSVNVVFPDPMSPATPRVKIQGDAAITSLKFLCCIGNSCKVMNQVPSCIPVLSHNSALRDGDTGPIQKQYRCSAPLKTGRERFPDIRHVHATVRA